MLPWRATWSTYIVVSSPPATEETGAMGRDIESRLGIGWYLLKNKRIITNLWCHGALKNQRKK
jgi:hypothetical protein